MRLALRRASLRFGELLRWSRRRRRRRFHSAVAEGPPPPWKRQLPRHCGEQESSFSSGCWTTPQPPRECWSR
eukprot:SAG25_NODE_70_length_17370_cov_11.748885_9_plen_72_part_00